MFPRAKDRSQLKERPCFHNFKLAVFFLSVLLAGSTGLFGSDLLAPLLKLPLDFGLRTINAVAPKTGYNAGTLLKPFLHDPGLLPFPFLWRCC